MGLFPRSFRLWYDLYQKGRTPYANLPCHIFFWTIDMRIRHVQRSVLRSRNRLAVYSCPFYPVGSYESTRQIGRFATQSFSRKDKLSSTSPATQISFCCPCPHLFPRPRKSSGHDSFHLVAFFDTSLNRNKRKRKE